mmetsp:Transcript_31087/g.100168  ORF Transcript_31087/g.100168 Transcript_31087/m.100168 type:complete len:408 (+) Transcript_31087:622-1845(+)
MRRPCLSSLDLSLQHPAELDPTSIANEAPAALRAAGDLAARCSKDEDGVASSFKHHRQLRFRNGGPQTGVEFIRVARPRRRRGHLRRQLADAEVEADVRVVLFVVAFVSGAALHERHEAFNLLPLQRADVRQGQGLPAAQTFCGVPQGLTRGHDETPAQSVVGRRLEVGLDEPRALLERRGHRQRPLGLVDRRDLLEGAELLVVVRDLPSSELEGEEDGAGVDVELGRAIDVGRVVGAVDRENGEGDVVVAASEPNPRRRVGERRDFLEEGGGVVGARGQGRRGRRRQLRRRPRRRRRREARLPLAPDLKRVSREGLDGGVFRRSFDAAALELAQDAVRRHLGRRRHPQELQPPRGAHAHLPGDALGGLRAVEQDRDVVGRRVGGAAPNEFIQQRRLGVPPAPRGIR